MCENHAHWAFTKLIQAVHDMEAVHAQLKQGCFASKRLGIDWASTGSSAWSPVHPINQLNFDINLIAVMLGKKQ